MLAEVALPGSIRSQQSAYGVHPALLDACFQSVAAHPGVGRSPGGAGLLLPLGVRRAPRLRSRPHRPLLLYEGDQCGAGRVEADLDVLDEHGHGPAGRARPQMGTGRLREPANAIAC